MLSEAALKDFKGLGRSARPPEQLNSDVIQNHFVFVLNLATNSDNAAEVSPETATFHRYILLSEYIIPNFLT